MFLFFFSFFLSYILFQADPLKHRGSLRSLFCQGFKDFISFLCKPRNISLFLSSIFLSSTFFPYLSLNQSPTLFFLQVPLDPAGTGPRQPRTVLPAWTPESRPGLSLQQGGTQLRQTDSLKLSCPSKLTLAHLKSTWRPRSVRINACISLRFCGPQQNGHVVKTRSQLYLSLPLHCLVSVCISALQKHSNKRFQYREQWSQTEDVESCGQTKVWALRVHPLLLGRTDWMLCLYSLGNAMGEMKASCLRNTQGKQGSHALSWKYRGKQSGIVSSSQHLVGVQ